MFWVIDNNEVRAFYTKSELNDYMERSAGMDARRVDSRTARNAMIDQLVGLAAETEVYPEPASYYRDYHMGELFHDYSSMVRMHRNILNHCPLDSRNY